MRWTAALLVLAACHRHHHDARPLREAIAGSWDYVCSIQRESDSTCPGKDDRPIRKTFTADGLVEMRGFGPDAMSDHGAWKLHDDTLEVAFPDGAGGLEVSRYRARLDDDQLVLWDTGRGFGEILARAGAHVDTEPLAVTPGGETSGEIEGVHYTIDLPTGYALTHDGDYQRWSPPDQGFWVELELMPSPDCHDSVGTARATIDGVDRETSVGIDHCVDAHRYVACNVGHTRRYLEAGEHDDALAICRSLRIE